MGTHRPISIIEIIKEAKAEALATDVRIIRKYLTPLQLPGTVFYLVFGK